LAEDFTEILEGPIDHEADVIEATANGAIAQWSPAVIVAPGTGETLPRVGTTTTLSDVDVAGVKSGPNETLVAGDICFVVVRGRIKVKVDAVTTRGQALGTSATAGKAAPIAVVDLPGTYLEATNQAEIKKILVAFAKAETATGAADGDIIACYVNRGILPGSA